MTIPVVIVDDNETDRYIVRRQLSRSGAFDVIGEAATGERCLERWFDQVAGGGASDRPLLIFMDINMPRMSGFETVEEIEQRIAAGIGPTSVVVLMFTSSQNPDDKARAAGLRLVSGLMEKPLDAADVDRIIDWYRADAEGAGGHARARTIQADALSRTAPSDR